jgi:uncharacterized BrkB/YihY/UPF0761 family membrane protein
MSHGFLFIAYCHFFTKKKAQGWSWATLGIILAASLILLGLSI